MGRDIGQEWEKMKGVMDRFFVPEELYQSVLANREIKKVTHAGMINSPKKKTPFKKRTTNTVNK
jgi:hypothetical protein